MPDLTDLVSLLPTVVAPLVSAIAGGLLLARRGTLAAGLIVLAGGLMGLVGFNVHRFLEGDETGYSHFANLADVFASYFSFVTVAIGILFLVTSKAGGRSV